jgi:hypothetical protein
MLAYEVWQPLRSVHFVSVPCPKIPSLCQLTPPPIHPGLEAEVPGRQSHSLACRPRERVVCRTRKMEMEVKCLVAHLVRDEGVAGSNPATPTKA